MWLSKLRLEIFAVLLTAPACGGDRQFGGDAETTGNVPLDACSDGEAQIIYDGERDTGFVRCPDGRINRARAVTCAAGGECQNDADCGPSQMCICPAGEVFEIPDLWHQGGTCHQVGCLDNDDCASGECGLAPTDDFSCGSRPGLQCRESTDACAAPDSCPDGSPCGIVGESFECTWFGCAGRPLLDDEHAPIFAPLCARDDWSAEPGADPIESLSPAQREALAEHWERCALGEHASVASFGRFALDLLALGAPAELLERTSSAMADEIEHTRLCFGVARRFRGHARGPGPLPVHATASASGRRQILAALIDEACIAETLAVAEAAAALEASRDPVVRETLLAIVKDETAHSALAWATLRWAFGNADPDERAWIATTLLRAAREQFQVAAHEAGRPEGPGTLRPWGLLDPAELAQARSQALIEVVGPAITSLLGAAATSVSEGDPADLIDSRA